MADDPRDKPMPEDPRNDDQTLPDGQPDATRPSQEPAPPDDDSRAMLSPDLEELNDLVDQPTLIDEQTTPEAKLINLKIPGYSIKSILGAGGMGTVYRAIQDSPQRLVALKVIRPGLASPRILRRFKYESEALGRLQHECIARIYDAGTTDDGGGAMPWFAMELIQDALSITEYAQRHNLSTRQRMTFPASVRCCSAWPPERHHSPRLEAREHPRHTRRGAEDHRLRRRPQYRC